MQRSGCILGCAAETRALVQTSGTNGADPGGPLTAECVGASRSMHGGVRVVQCSRCHLAWQAPMPEPARVRQAYDRLEDERYIDETSGRRRSLKRGLRLIHRYHRGEPGRLLDVGCATGIFLELAAEAGWSVVGLEPSRWLFERARRQLGDRVVNRTFEEAGLDERSFDAVTLWDVLEHLVDPVAAIARCAAVLRPGGLLVLNTPNVDSLIARVMRSKWPLLLPEHLYYFSPAALDELLRKAGFTVLGRHLHPVFFGLGYVAHRLARHRVAGTATLEKLAGGLGLGAVEVPLLLGELTVVARRGPGA